MKSNWLSIVEPWRDYLLLAFLGSYVLFNAGLMQLRVGPIPIGELVLIFALLTINYSKLYHMASKTIFIWPFILWWIYGFVSAFYAYTQHGIWALRDASQLIESLFLLVGFVYALNFKNIETFYKALPYFLFLVVAYAITADFGNFFPQHSPVIHAMAGYDTSLFFLYLTIPCLLIFGISFFSLFQIEKKKYWALIGVMFFEVVFFQMRMPYLQLITVFALFFIFYRKIFYPLFFIFVSVFIALEVLNGFGFHLKGLLHQPLSLIDLKNELMTMIHPVKDLIMKSEVIQASASNTLKHVSGWDKVHELVSAINPTYDWLIHHDLSQAKAYGVLQRLSWWKHIYEEMTAHLKSALLGLGYGKILTNFVHPDYHVVIREPHNSYISVLARLGLIGFFFWSWMHLLLLKIGYSAYQKCRKRADLIIHSKRLFILFIYFLLIALLALGEDALEKSYNAIPYYFLWGMVLGYVYHLKFNQEVLYESAISP
jgi:hypothetical protein